jgi:CubicO group peptidase (beta-lactamase class C family)
MKKILALVGGPLLIFISGCQDGAEPALTPTPATTAQTPAITWQDYDDYLRQLTDNGQFSGVFAVIRNGERLADGAFGDANREHGIPNSADMKFCIASMGKMFTAVAIAQLVEAGKLAFDDTIGRYLSGFPAEIADTVTIEHLLTHTAGMGDAALRRSPDQPSPPTTLDGMMQRIIAAPLQFQPGTGFAYSNDDFIVLGAIIESVTGGSYADYLRTHVFEPAGMDDTDVATHCPAEDVSDAAQGYPSEPGDRRDMGEIGNPSGGGYSTAPDMLRFADALMDHTLVGPDMTETVLAGKVDTDRPGSERDQYAYGFNDRQVNGVRVVGHNGGSPGYEAQLDIYPDLGYAAVILANQGEAAAPAMRRLEDLLISGVR